MPGWLRRCAHTHTHTYTDTALSPPPPTHTEESSRASALTREDGGFTLAGKRWREKAKSFWERWEGPRRRMLLLSQVFTGGKVLRQLPAKSQE